MAIVINGNGIDMGGNPVSNASQVDSTVINENGSNVVSQGELAYNVDTSSYIPNTLASGAIIERGSNANGEYIKYADGTMICNYETTVSYTCNAVTGSIFSVTSGGAVNLTLPATFAVTPRLVLGCTKTGGGSVPWNSQGTPPTTTTTGSLWLHASVNTAAGTYKYLAIGRWK